MTKRKCKIQVGNMFLDAELDITNDVVSEEEKLDLNKAFADMKAFMEKHPTWTVEGTTSEPIIPIRQAILSYLCSQCCLSSLYPRTIVLGNNITDLTCPHCGEMWHVSIQVLQLEPLVVGDWLSKRKIGVFKNGVFFDKSTLQ